MRSAGDSAIAGNRERMEYHLSALQRRPSASAPPWTVHSLGQPRALSPISCPLSHLAVGLAPFRSARASALWQAVARNLQKQLLFRGACPLLRLSRKGQETTDSLLTSLSEAV